MAASATLALNDGEWLRRGRLGIFLLQSQGLFALQVARTPLSGQSSFLGPPLKELCRRKARRPFAGTDLPQIRRPAERADSHARDVGRGYRIHRDRRSRRQYRGLQARVEDLFLPS